MVHRSYPVLKDWPLKLLIHPILIHKFQTQIIRDTFYKNIEPLGFKIIELPHNQKYNLNDQVQINILVADGCDPSLCGKHFGCNPTTENDSSMQIDTLCVINDSKYTIINTNDSPIELTKPKVLPQIKQQYKKIDFLLHGYTMAGHYPQCTVSLTKNEMLKEAERVMKLNYERCMGYIRYLNPDERSTAALIRNGLIKFKKEKGPMETSPGITMERIGLKDVLKKLPKPVLLSENGKDEIGEAKTFILGDDKNPTDEEINILNDLPSIKLGKDSLLSSACITLMHHLLDT